MDETSNYKKIWDTIANIPRGKVASYGQIARIAGLGKRARLVGYALHRTPENYNIPWHRVINAQGKISFPLGSTQYQEQKHRLMEEGIDFLGERVDLERYRWRPEGDDIVPEMFLEEFCLNEEE